MDFTLKNIANDIHQLFQERRLCIYRAQIQQLDQILQALKRYKSECTSTIATVQTLLLRKRELKFKQNHSRALQGLYYKMVKHNKDKEEGETYRLWFEKLKRLKSYSFELTEFRGIYSLRPPLFEEKEAAERTQLNYVYLQNLMKEDIKTYIQLMQSLQHSTNHLRMPVEHLRYLIEGLKKHNYHWAVYQQMRMILAYKVMSKMDVSEQQLRENRQLLERMYDELVDKNQDSEDAEEWRKQFFQFESTPLDNFADGVYIRGDDLDQFRAKREKPSDAISCEVNPLVSSERIEGQEGKQSLSAEQQNEGQKESQNLSNGK